MYFIIGGDGKEYGPVSEQDVRQWLAEGRLAAPSLAKGEGDAEFRPLEKFPEFAALFAPAVLGMARTPPAIAPLQPPPGFAPGAAPSNVLPDDYELDIISCLTRGWELVKKNFSTLFLGALVFCGIQLAAIMFGQIPILGVLISIANFVCAGPLLAGLFFLFIRVNRGEPAQVGEVFAGFRRGFGQLFLAKLVQSVVVGICFLPVIFLFGARFVSVMGQLQAFKHNADPEAVKAVFSELLSVLFAAVPIGLVCALPAIFLTVCWQFSLPLIIDRQMDFVTAMKTSWRMVMKHWFLVFGLLAMVSVLNVVGVLLCCVPVLMAFPVGIAALMIAYETIFGPAKK